MAKRMLLALAVGAIVAAIGTTSVWACAGLVTASGNVRVLRTTTLAAYHDGLEHYVTSFEFAGGGGAFGSLVPLPAVPSKIERGGDWTLQRLQLEVQRRFASGATAASSGGASSGTAEELAHERIDALDLTVLRGGAAAIAEWASAHGFSLSPDAPEVLEFYAARSPIFMAAVFDGDAAEGRGQQLGEGTPVHLTIPTDNPWVPLRILGLGRPDDETVDADIFLLTDRRPNLLPGPGTGLSQRVSEPASTQLLDDLRSDTGMAWVPSNAHLTYLRLSEAASQVRYDLAVEADGTGRPSAVAAGLSPPPAPTTSSTAPPPTASTSTSAPTSTAAGAADVALATERDVIRPASSSRHWQPHWFAVGVALVAIAAVLATLPHATRARRRR